MPGGELKMQRLRDGAAEDAMEPAVEHAGENQGASTVLAWVTPFPIWGNRVVMQQLGLVFVISLLMLGLILTFILWPPSGETALQVGKIVSITGGIFFALMLLGATLVSLGGYLMEYHMDAHGISARPHGRTAKRNALINTLLVFSGRPSAMGAGILAQSRQAEYVAWKDVDQVVPDLRRRTITLYRNRWPLMVVACDEAHYEAVLLQAQQHRHRVRAATV